MSAGEERAWAALRRLRPHGVHVVRQHKIGRYTVDFTIRRQRVAIEVDGGVHNLPGRLQYDAMRQSHLESKGWRFVRVSAEATHDPKFVVDAVLAVLPLPLRAGGRGWGETPTDRVLNHAASSTTSASASPHPPTPSPQGEGEGESEPNRRTRANRKLKPRRKGSRAE